MEQSDLKSEREKRERGTSVKGLLQEALNNAAGYDSLLIVGLKGDEVETGYSTDNNLILLGALEIAKGDLLDSFYE